MQLTATGQVRGSVLFLCFEPWQDPAAGQLALHSTGWAAWLDCMETTPAFDTGVMYFDTNDKVRVGT